MTDTVRVWVALVPTHTLFWLPCDTCVSHPHPPMDAFVSLATRRAWGLLYLLYLGKGWSCWVHRSFSHELSLFHASLSHIAVAVAGSSDSTPILRTSICHKVSPNKPKQANQSISQKAGANKVRVFCYRWDYMRKDGADFTHVVLISA